MQKTNNASFFVPFFVLMTVFLGSLDSILDICDL